MLRKRFHHAVWMAFLGLIGGGAWILSVGLVVQTTWFTVP